MIRKAIKSDLSKLSNLISDHLSGSNTDLDKIALAEQVTTQLKKCLQNKKHFICVAEVKNQKIAGYIIAHWIPFPLLKGSEMYISDLVISPQFRGKGFGSKLIAKVEAEARIIGCCRLMVNNPCMAESYKRNFYRKQGFEERNKFANFVKIL